jgi:hypothetical protein
VAFPGTFIVNRQGRVDARFFEDFYIERNTVSGILKRIGGRDGQVAGMKIATAQLDITTYPSDAAVAPGNRFALVVDIAPHRGIHVYAPGASGYKVMALAIAPQPFVRALAPTYPASEIYFFKPLNERVPVYQRAFRLVQEVVLEGQPQAQQALRGKESLTLTGTLDYQACDDKLCYNPSSVPLTWTVALRPLVTQRPKVER